VQRASPGDVRFQLAQPLGTDQLDRRNAVRKRPAVQLLEPRQLALVGCDDHLPAAEDRDPALVAVGEQGSGALDAELRLQRPGGVVDASVDDTARVARLVRTRHGFLVDDADVVTGTASLELARGGEADDAGAHHDHVEP
jgi:hypothetical protein